MEKVRCSGRLRYGGEVAFRGSVFSPRDVETASQRDHDITVDKRRLFVRSSLLLLDHVASLPCERRQPIACQALEEAERIPRNDSNA